MPNLTHQELVQAVLDGSIGAICIDTSVLQQYGFGFEFGVLAQLSQFDRIAPDHLVVDILEHEVRSHLAAEAEKHKLAVLNALKFLGGSWGVQPNRRQEALATLFGGKTEQQRTDERLEEFFNNSHAVRINSADFADVARLVDLYTGVRPPFADKSDKKHEFPDALALLALEGWAEKKGVQYVLTVSGDKGWESYCATSESLLYLKELPAALSLFHPTAEQAVQLFRTAVNSGEMPDFDQALLTAINTQADRIDVQLEAYSSFFFEEELTRFISPRPMLPLVSNWNTWKSLTSMTTN